MLLTSALRGGFRLSRSPIPSSALALSRTIAGAPQYNSFGAAKNRTKSRPISPHVQIYAFPLPAITSILHRATGTGLTLGISHELSLLIFLGLVAASIPVLINPALVVPIMAWVKSVPIIHIALKFALSYGFSIHLLAGLRHFVC